MATAKKASKTKTAAGKSAAKKGAKKKTAVKKAATGKPGPGKSAAKKPASKKPAGKKIAAKEAAAKKQPSVTKAASKAGKKAATRKTAANRTTPKKAATTKSAKKPARKSSLGKASTGKVAARKTASGKAAPGKAARGKAKSTAKKAAAKTHASKPSAKSATPATKAIRAGKSPATVTKAKNPLDTRPGFPPPRERHPKSGRSEKLPQTFATESSAKDDARRTPATQKRKQSAKAPSSPPRTVEGAVKQPPRKRTKRLTPEESGQQMRALLEAKQTRDRQGPTWPAANAHTGGGGASDDLATHESAMPSYSPDSNLGVAGMHGRGNQAKRGQK